jgi:hypothetical protein
VLSYQIAVIGKLFFCIYSQKCVQNDPKPSTPSQFLIRLNFCASIYDLQLPLGAAFVQLSRSLQAKIQDEFPHDERHPLGGEVFTKSDRQVLSTIAFQQGIMLPSQRSFSDVHGLHVLPLVAETHLGGQSCAAPELQRPHSAP